MRIKLILTFLLVGFVSFAQNSSWEVTSAKRQQFVENIGQYDQSANEFTGTIRYVAELPGMKVFFGEEGISYSFKEVQMIPKEARDSLRALIASSDMDDIEEHKIREEVLGKFLNRWDEVNMRWDIVSENLSIIGVDQKEGYTCYGGTKDEVTGEDLVYNYANSFNSIRYNNIVDGIDIVYTMHPQGGIKYSLEVAPGANLSAIRMIYDEDPELNNGQLFFSTLFGDMIEDKPTTFYGDQSEESIFSQFILQGNAVSFSLEAYDQQRPIIVDPWQYTSFNGAPGEPNYLLDWDCVWELDVDAAGNVYTIGGVDNLTLSKYNSAGVFQWEYNTTYDTTAWLGTLAVDDLGTSYVTNGSSARIMRINNLGVQQWSNTNPGSCFICLNEFWSIAFNCDQTRLLVGGTDGGVKPFIHDVDMTNGNTLSSVQVAGGGLNEVRSLTSGLNNKYYFISHDTIGFIYDDFGNCAPGLTDYVEKDDHGAGLGYKCDNWRYNNTGIRAIRANENYVYTVFGDVLQRRDLLTLAVINQVTIPNGQFNTGFFNADVSNSGIDLDDCGNVYVGSTNGVYKFNADLSTPAGTNFAATPYRVWDVRVNANNEVVACGGNGQDSDPFGSVRNGFVGSYSFTGVCNPVTDTCNSCNTNFCVPESICNNDPIITLGPIVPGGTFSGPGVTPSGDFDPNLAGVGNHLITYTLPCGSSSQLINVVPCNLPLGVCEETNGTLTASGGSGSYSWYTGTSTATTINITNAATCTSCGGTPIMIFGFIYDECEDGLGNVITSCSSSTFSWNATPYSTSTNSPAPTSYPIQIVDSDGEILIINNAGELSPCAPAPLAIDLASFDARCAGNNVIVEWETLSEMNSDHFVIEKGNSQGYFEEIGTETSLGNEFSGHVYRFVDPSNDQQFAYYRLIEVTTDGEREEIATKHVDCGDSEIKVFPNPFNDELNVCLGDFVNNAEGLIEIVNSYGQIVLQRAVQKDEECIQLLVDDLSNGVYFVKVKTNNLTHMSKLVKQ